MNHIPIISARTEYEEFYPYETHKWKEQCFLKLWQRDGLLDKAAITNLLVVGDSDYEMKAGKAFGNTSDKCLVKQIKLREMPNLEDLAN